MRYRSIFPVLALGAALTVTACGTDDRDDYDAIPPATETTAPVGTEPVMTPGVYDTAPGMTTDTAMWGDTTGFGTGVDTVGAGM